MFEDLMGLQLLMRAMQESEKDNFASPHEAGTALKAFLTTERPTLEVNDFVERNDYGRAYYKVPGQNQAAIVTEILTGDKIGPSGEDVMLCVAVGKDRFVFTKVDSRYYRKAAAQNGDNVFTFRKK